jgi:hypothetical protein
MAGQYWRLLAALSLILLAPAFLRGQDRVEERNSVFAPKLEMLRSYPPIRPGRFPLSPNLPWQPPVAPGTVAFDSVVSAAGIIFSGRVTSIRRAPLPAGEGPACTTVTFQVDHAIRGIAQAQSLTIHEWAGLWNGGERYHVGENLMLFLYPPSKLGLTSPVAGEMGRYAVDSQGRILMNGQNSASLMTDPILGNKTVVPYPDFVAAIRRSSHEE